MVTDQPQLLSVARDLHDTVLQEFLVILMQLRRLDDGTPPRDAAARVDFSLQAAQRGIARVRELLGDLRTSETSKARPRLRTIPPNSLSGEIASTLDAVLGHTSLNVDLQCPNDISLPPLIQREFVNIVREAATNVVRHARARTIDCSITSNGQLVRAVVEDDGEGLAAKTVEGGYGMAGMRERAELIGATLKVQSSRDRGVRVELSLPFRAASAKPVSTRRPQLPYLGMLNIEEGAHELFVEQC